VAHISPVTDEGLEWQVRSYISKKTLPLLHDFCFKYDREQQRQRYIQDHGIDSYYFHNITNMKEILKSRQQYFRNQLLGNQCIELELLLHGSAADIQNSIQQVSGVNVAIDHIEQVVQSWRNLHWDHTEEWNYHNIFKK
jgi:hypothetical protein